MADTGTAGNTGTPGQTPAPAGFTPASALEDAISSAFGQSLVEQGVPETELERDASGRFKPRHSDEDFTTETEAERAEKAQKATIPTGEPSKGEKEGEKPEIVTLPAADLTKLATVFKLKDATGELAVPEGLLIEYQANGKPRVDSLDKVVKMAQMGVYNHEREQRVMQVQHEAEEVRTYATEVERRLQTREEQIAMLLKDPRYREEAIQAYEEQQLPEAQAQRLAREREDFRIEQERTLVAQQGTTYYQTQVVPSLDILAKAVPHVTPDEIGQKLRSFVDRLRDPRTGLVSPERYETINQHFLTEIVPWAQSLDDYRATERGVPSGRQQQVDAASAHEKTKAELEAAQLRAAKARRAASANLKPPGKVAGATAPAKKAPVTRDEIMEDIIASTKQAVLAGE